MRTIVIIAALLSPSMSLAGGLNCVHSDFSGATSCIGTDSNGEHVYVTGQEGPWGQSTWSTHHGDHFRSADCTTSSEWGTTACVTHGD